MKCFFTHPKSVQTVGLRARESVEERELTLATHSEGQKTREDLKRRVGMG